MDAYMHEHDAITCERRVKLLDAAGAVFADRGFHHATIREICRRAGANVAAVNYHFRDKESLYQEVLTWCGRVALEKYPLGGGVSPDAAPADQLAGFIRNYLDRLLGTGRPAWHGKLISREMVEPTRALDALAEQFVRPQYQRLSGIVRDLLGPDAPEPVVRRCCFSVVGQCLFMKLCRPMIARIVPHQGYGPEDIAAMAEHITRSSLALIAAAGAACRATAGSTPAPETAQ